MTKQRVAGMTLLVIAAAAVASAQSIHDHVVQTYGLSRLTPKNRDEVARVIVFAARAADALENSGFKVYTLDKVVKKGFDEIYVWSDSSGNQLETEHFIGVGVVTMRPGQAFIGDAGPLWLVVHKDGWEVKFTIK